MCLVLSGLYSGSETALTALGATGAQRLLDKDPRQYRILRRWVDNPFRVLTTLLVGNNLVNTTAAALAGSASARIFPGSRALPIAIAVITFLLLTFGEIGPKIFSKAYSERLAVPAMRFVNVSYYLFFLVSEPFVIIARKGLKATGQDPDEMPQVTEDDIEFMVNLGAEAGSLEPETEKLLHSVLEFSDTTVKEVMVPRVDMIGIEDTTQYADLLHTLVECGHSRIPVYHDTLDEIIGMFYAKDLLQHFLKGEGASEFKLVDHVRPAIFVPTSKKVDDLLREFQLQRIHIAVAVDEFGGTAGVVTLEDIVEEFFGEIQDEFDREEPMIVEHDDYHMVDARADIDDLEDGFEGLTFPEAREYESLGGFMSEESGRVPQPGESVVFSGYLFTVVTSEPTHVVSVRIEETDLSPEEHTESGGHKSVAV